MHDLEKTVAIITGGASGIGKAIAETLAKQQCKITILDIDDEKGAATKEELNKISETEYYHCDVSSIDEITKTFNKVVERFGYADVLVNNAGIPIRDYIEDINEEKWDLFTSINMKSVFFFSQIFAEHIKKRNSGYGRIVNLTSVRSKLFDDYHSGYSITKEAVNSITKCFAVNYGKFGLTANSVGPAFVLTAMTEHYKQDPSAADMIKTISPIQRAVEASEIADLVAFLASKKAGAINGQAILVDGGGTCIPGLYQ